MHPTVTLFIVPSKVCKIRIKIGVWVKKKDVNLKHLNKLFTDDLFEQVTIFNEEQPPSGKVNGQTGVSPNTFNKE